MLRPTPRAIQAALRKDMRLQQVIEPLQEQEVRDTCEDPWACLRLQKFVHSGLETLILQNTFTAQQAQAAAEGLHAH